MEKAVKELKTRNTHLRIADKNKAFWSFLEEREELTNCDGADELQKEFAAWHLKQPKKVILILKKLY